MTELYKVADALLSRLHTTPRQLQRLEGRFFRTGLPVPTDLTVRLLELGLTPRSTYYP